MNALLYSKKIPFDVLMICDYLHEYGYEAFLCGGACRDLIMNLEPKDWDITTNATPEVAKDLFTFHKFNVIETGLKHGTVTVVINKLNYEITTFRADGEYSDGRHPDTVVWAKTIEEDLSRRDFTMNAIAYSSLTKTIIDPFNGIEDIKSRIIKCVGNPYARFQEDALRMMRAIRFSAQKRFSIENTTYAAIRDLSFNINKISSERIKDELDKILMTETPSIAFMSLNQTKLLFHILPELIASVGCEQFNPNHIFDVWEHTLFSLDSAENDLLTRWAVLLHDIGKPASKVRGDDGFDHFYKHPIKSVELSEKILTRLKFDNNSKETILKLVEYHDYDLLAKKSAIKRLINKGVDIERWFKVRHADIQGHKMDTQEKNIKGLKECKALYEEIKNFEEPISVKDLAINGNDLMVLLKLEPGRVVGEILKHLLDLVIEDPKINTWEGLTREAFLFYNKSKEV